MDADGKVRRQVSLDQLTALLEFLKEHQELAKGLTRGRRGKFHTLKIWNLCAKKLNTVKDGAVKDGKGWSKYWCDWKYRVRRRALELKAAKQNNRPPPDGVIPLSPMEETILSIIGENAVDGVVIKSDPLGEANSDEEEQDNNDHFDDVATSQYYGNQSQSHKKRRHSSKDVSDMDDTGCGPSTPVQKKHKTNNKNGHYDDSDHDDEASEFLRLERERLEISKLMTESLQNIHSDLRSQTDILGQIRDILANNRIHL